MAEQATTGQATTGLMAGAPPFRGQAQVTLANWQDPPFNAWAFQHIRELIPTARIAPASDPAPLPRAAQDLSGLAFRSEDRDWTVGDVLAASHTDGFLVLHRGQVVAEHYANGMTPGTPHLLMSVSKSVTAAVAGVLAGRGLLDPAAGISSIVPELRDHVVRGCDRPAAARHAHRDPVQ